MISWQCRSSLEVVLACPLDDVTVEYLKAKMPTVVPECLTRFRKVTIGGAGASMSLWSIADASQPWWVMAAMKMMVRTGRIKVGFMMA